MITGLEELHPRYLKGYGDVPEPLNIYLRQRLSDLLEALEIINRILIEEA